MKKVMTNEEKIAKIKSERKQLLETVKTSIQNNRDNLTSEIDKLFAVLKEDEKNTKKYESLLQAKSLIQDFIKQILEADTIEDIVNIRKKLNYYINKIKKELIKRGYDENSINNYLAKVVDTRKDIAKLIRFLKREGNIELIDHILNNDDDVDSLKSLIKKEERFNRSYMSAEVKPNEDKNTVIPAQEDDFVFGGTNGEQSKTNENEFSFKFVDNSEPDNELSFSPNRNSIESDESSQLKKRFRLNDAERIKEVDRLIQESNSLLGGVESPEDCDLDKVIADVKDGFTEPIYLAREEKLDDFSLECENDESKDELSLTDNFTAKSYKNDVDYLNHRLLKYRRHYKIQRTYEYKGKLSDCVLLFKNMPIYSHNRSRIKKMEFDSRFYGGGDFVGYIDYLKNKSSLKFALKMIFSKSYFNSLEAQYLNAHEKCIQWVLDFCKERELGFYYQKEEETSEKILTLV